MFDRILVPLDGTDVATNSLVAGSQLAKRWGCRLEALTLMGEANDVGLERVIREQTDGVVAPANLQIRSLQYSVAEDIAAVFDEVPNTLVVMNTDAHGRSAAIAENISEQVMRNIRQPVLLLGRDVTIAEGWPECQILVCTDGSDFAERVAGPAAAWAQSLELPLKLVTVIDMRKVPAGYPVAGETNAVTHLIDTIQNVPAAPGSDGTIRVDYDVLHGPDPADAIVDQAKNSPISIILMATHGRSGMQRALYGSVAMKVIREAPCPVLVFRP